MEPQAALAEREDDHIEDESFPAGKVKDGFHIDNENLPWKESLFVGLSLNRVNYYFTQN